MSDNLQESTVAATPEFKASILEVALRAANRAAELIRSRRQENSVQVSFKGARDLVTTTDIESEKLIIETIKSSFPEHGIVAEESSAKVDHSKHGRGPVWVIDPIDGTTNFAHGHLHVGVSIGFAIDGVAQVGVVHSPFENEVFSAIRGEGASMNGNAIHATTTDKLSDALVATGFPYYRTHVELVCARLQRVLQKCRDVRRSGAASLDFCWVACGRLDAFYEEGLMPWDGVAGRLIAEEAGAVSGHYEYDHDGQKRSVNYQGDLFMDNVVVSTKGVFEELMVTLSPIAPLNSLS